MVVSKQCQCFSTHPFCSHTEWKVALVGSHFTHSAESRYAPVEVRALAIADALEKARYFVLGCDDLIVAVDHKPLLKVLGDRSLEDTPNARLRYLKKKTLCNKFRLMHIPCAKHRAADCVSCHPTGRTEKMRLTDDTSAILQIVQTSPPPDSTLLHSFLVGIPMPDMDAPACNPLDEAITAAATLAMDSIQSMTWNSQDCHH